MQTRPRVRRTGASRFRASRVLVGCLIAFGVSACGDSGGDGVPTVTDADAPIDSPTGSPGLEPIDGESGMPDTDIGTDAPGTDAVPPSDGPVTIEPPGSGVADSERALFEFLGQRFDSPSDFDVWNCVDGDGATAAYYFFGRPDPLDPGAATTLGTTGDFYDTPTGFVELFGIDYDVTSNDTFTVEFSRQFVEVEDDESGEEAEDVGDQLLENLAAADITFDTFEEFQAFVSDNGLGAVLGDIGSLEELEALLASDDEDGGPDDEQEEVERELVIIENPVVDELTSVRIGPGRSWSGFSMVGNAALNCTEEARAR